MRIDLGDVTLWFDVSGPSVGARHNIFRDRPDLAFPAVEEFIRHVKDGERAG